MKIRSSLNTLCGHKTIPFILFLLLSLQGLSQVVVDKVVAVVGSKIILSSDIEKQYVQYLAQGAEEGELTRCLIFDQLLLQKLMLNQAELDSIQVSEAQVESELDRRMRFYIKQIGSEAKLEEYFKTTVRKLKDELREMIREQLLVQNMQGTITKDVVATPANVREFFESIHPDSLPYIDAEMEIAQIVRKPPVNDEERKRVKSVLEEYRRKIMAGEDFAVYAALYSEDKSTAKRGGELGMFERGTMVPEFEAAAFNLRSGEVSPVIETKFGFHILQLIERRADQINVRHILLQPQTSDKDLYKAYAVLDSLRKEIQSGTISFDEAAQKFSDDEETRNNGGLMMNPETGTTRLSPDKMERLLFFQVDSMSLNTVSSPLNMSTPDGKQAYRIVMVKARNAPHKANLKDDYQRIQEVALQNKQNKVLEDWVKKKRSHTYVHINESMPSCELLKVWTQGSVK
jgi:peptidyl-prolyl cis-trans isomerase SurA